jgi:hypothetical protein
MPAPFQDTALEIEAERRLLLKAATDIEQGWSRLRNQQELLTSLRASGQHSAEGERLVDMLQRMLIEWERHRDLIEQRLRYLERGAASSDPQE